MLNCNMMTKSLFCVTAQVRDLPTYDGLKMVDEFLHQYESAVPENQRFDALKCVLCVSPAQWWGTQEGNFESWKDCKRIMQVGFGKMEL